MAETDNRVQLTQRFEEALVYAFRLHAAQRRKGSGAPYISHLLGVAALVLEDGGDEDEAVAALLHDAVEDQGGQAAAAEIRRRFGERVAAIVLACSDADTQPKPPWLKRKARFLQTLDTLPADALRVLAADKLYNVRSLLRAYRLEGEGAWARFRGGREGTLWYYRQALRGLAARGGGPLVDELREALGALEALMAADVEDDAD